jgi:hypothetical protein
MTLQFILEMSLAINCSCLSVLNPTQMISGFARSNRSTKVTKSQISLLYAQAATPSYMTAAIPAEKRQLGQDICSRAGTIFPRFSDSLYSCIDQIAAYCQSRLKIPKAGTLRPAPPKQPRIRLNAVSYKKLR